MEQEPDIHPHGYWIGPGGHYTCPALIKSFTTLFGFWGCLTCYDLGCGDGTYTKALRKAGYNCVGIDNNPAHLADYIQHFDLTQELTAAKRDVVLSLEVGEHIPERFEDVFIGNVTRLAKRKIVISWAIPNQEGHGHVNCRPNEWVIEKFAKLGWIHDEKASERFRKETTLWWLKKTIMVFSKF